LLKKILLLLVLLIALCGGWIGYAMVDIPAALTSSAPAGRVLFDDVRLISMVPGAPAHEEARAVLVVDGEIEAVGAAGSLTPGPGTVAVDGAGKTLIPGLIDAHIHLNDEAELAGYLAHGVTGVRNMSGYPFHLPLARRIEAGELLAPDFLTTGPILNSPGPNQNLIQQIVTSGSEARAAVRAQYAAGYRTLKVYSNLTREAFEAILEESRRLDMALTGHSPEGARAPGIPRQKPFDIAWGASVGQGFTTLEHIETIVWHSLRDDLSEGRMDAVAQRLAQSGDVVTPTLIAHQRLVMIAQTRGAHLDRAGSDTINPFMRLLERGAEQHWREVDVSAYEAPHAAFFLAATRQLHEAGVPLIAGTDAGGIGLIPGAALARELELLVAAGMTPHEALAAATRISAETLGFDRTGVIAPGYRANLVLLGEDPLARIGAVDSPLGVMVRGYWLDASGVAAMQAAARDTSMTRSFWRALRMLAANR